MIKTASYRLVSNILPTGLSSTPFSCIAYNYNNNIINDNNIIITTSTKHYTPFLSSSSNTAHWRPSAVAFLDERDEQLTPELTAFLPHTPSNINTSTIGGGVATATQEIPKGYLPLTLKAREFLESQSDHLQYHFVDDEWMGQRLDDFVLQQYPEWSYDSVRKLIENGYIYRYSKNGKKSYSRCTDRLQADQLIIVPTSAFWQNQIAPPSGIFVEDPRLAKRKDVHLSNRTRQLAREMVLFKNEHVIVIDKPYGVPMTASANKNRINNDNRTDNATHDNITINIADMLSALKFTNHEKPHIVNMLDTETTGCVLLARSLDGQRLLSKMFMRRVAPNSVFWAYCVGRPVANFGRVCMHMELHEHDRLIVRPTPTAASRVALAEFVVNASALEYGSFVSLYPLTNRRHQSRIMCAHALRCPIMGDRKFGGEAAFPQSLATFWGVDRKGVGDGGDAIPLHLHHRKVQLPYKKGNGQFISVTAPVPPHLARTMEKMGWPSDVDDPLVPS